MPRTQRFKVRESDRSGFRYREIQLVDDEGSLVGPDEFDQPPPSNIPLGGEGESSPGDTNPTYQSYTSNVVQRTTQFLAAGASITASPSLAELNNERDQRHWIYISGSNSNVTLTASPRITAGQTTGKFLTIECVGSGVTIVSGGGFSMGKPFAMTSGAIINFVWTKTA